MDLDGQRSGGSTDTTKSATDAPKLKQNELQQRPPPPHKEAPIRYDSYVPDDVYIPDDSYIPSYDRTGKRVQRDKEGEQNIPKDLAQFHPMTQDYLNTINEDPRRPVNPIPTQVF